MFKMKQLFVAKILISTKIQHCGQPNIELLFLITSDKRVGKRLDAGTGLLISYELQRGILLRRENPTYRYWARAIAAARHGFKMVLFTASCGNTFVGGTCALLSALLVSNKSDL